MPENTEPNQPNDSNRPDQPHETEVSFTVAGPDNTFVDGPIHTAEGRELWVLSIGFYAHDPVHAMTMARHATRRVAKVFPRFNKDHVHVLRQSTYDHATPLYCDLDIYCVQPPMHTGPCRCQDGRNLDDYNDDTDPTPEFGGDI